VLYLVQIDALLSVMLKNIKSDQFLTHKNDTPIGINQNLMAFYSEDKVNIRGLLEKYPTFGREKETGLLGALDT